MADPATGPPAPAPAGGLVPLGRQMFRMRGWIYLPFAAAAVALPREPWSHPEVVGPAGFLLMATGVAVRFLCIRRMHGAARTHKDKAKRLVATGPYAWVRNPLYVANTGAFLGFLLLCGHTAFAAASWILLWACHHAIARYEETVLRGAFPAEFEVYRREVPLWIPRPPRNPPAEDPAGLYPVARVLRKERAALMNVAAMLGLAAAKWTWLR